MTLAQHRPEVLDKADGGRPETKTGLVSSQHVFVLSTRSTLPSLQLFRELGQDIRGSEPAN